MSEPAEVLGQPLIDFLAALAGESPAPGGGSAAALAVAMAAGLIQSVARLSLECWDEAGGAIAQADALECRVAPLVALDARAYQEALRTLAERTAIATEERDARLGEALERAADLPLEIGEAAADVAELAAVAAERGEHAVQADALAAAILAEAAARVVLRLVEVNLGMIDDDPRIDCGRQLVARAAASMERALAAGCE